MSEPAIRIGTLVKGGTDTADYIRQILPHGFESFSITFWRGPGKLDIKKVADQVNEVLADSDAVISSVGVYGNPLTTGDDAKLARDGWKKLVDNCHLFGCDVVAGFTGRVVGKPIPESIPAFKKFFGPLAKKAADKGVRIAFENCQMGGDWNTGDWNIAHTPDAWEMMFDAVPAENLGLEWEPCHQMVALVDPMAQLRQWVGKMFHIHGKDATVMWDVIARHGIKGPKPFAFHRTPGFGDSNWTDIISELRRGGFVGSIDIEGWHDPVYRGDLEMTGQVAGLNYLKRCRADFIPNPS